MNLQPILAIPAHSKKNAPMPFQYARGCYFAERQLPSRDFWSMLSRCACVVIDFRVKDVCLLRFLLLTGLLLGLASAPGAEAAEGVEGAEGAEGMEGTEAPPQSGQWIALEDGTRFDRGLAPDLTFPPVEVSHAGGGVLWHELTFTLTRDETVVLDFTSSSTLDLFTHHVLDASGSPVAQLSGGLSRPEDYQYFLRHGQRLELPAGEYRVFTRMESPFYLALPKPRVFYEADYARQIPYTQSLTLIGLGIFLALIFYYSVMAVWRGSRTDLLYALFITGNLLYNGAALLVYSHLFGWTWFYLTSTPILLSNVIYIAFVMRLLRIERAEQPALFWLGMGAMGLLIGFWPLALLAPNWSMEFCRAGVAVFALYGLISGITRSLQGDKVARLYLIANAAFAVPALVAISLQSLSTPLYLVEHLGMVAVLIEVLLLAQVLSYQIGQVYKERAEIQSAGDRAKMLDNLTSQAPGMIYQFEMAPDGRFSMPFVSRQVEKYAEISPEEAVHDIYHLFKRVHPKDYNDFKVSIIHSARHLIPWKLEFRVILPVAGMQWLEGSAEPERLADGTTRWYGFISDVTERKKLEDHMRHLAQHDPLTQLPNRALFSDRLEHALKSAARLNNRLALMFIDLDNFKTINDQYGHDLGDQLLQQVAQALAVNLRAADTVARLGGDEFVVLLETVTSLEEAQAVAEKIRQSCERPIPVGAITLSISTSIGLALFPDHASTELGLMRAADQAMYRAKKRGRNQIQASETITDD